MRRRLHLWLRSTRATAAVEFAMIAPVLLLLTGGIIEFGLAFQVYNGANRVASQYAVAWADCPDTPAGTCQTELGKFSDASAIANIVPQLVPTRLTLTMFQVKMVGTTPTVVLSYPSSASLTSEQTTAAQAAFTAGQTGVIVSVTYNHALQFFSAMTTVMPNLTAAYTVTQLRA